MTRLPDFQFEVSERDYYNGAGEPVFEYTVRLPNFAQRKDHYARLRRFPPSRAYTPALSAGEPFDPPEEPWPSDATATWHPPQGISTESAPQGLRDDYPPEGVNGWAKPPNCDGNALQEALIALHDEKDES